MVRSATRGGAFSARERSVPGGRSSAVAAVVTRGTVPRMTHDGDAADAITASSVWWLARALAALVAYWCCSL
jgi:hypothetical protein